MELRGLRYFVTVAEELHFGRAAERLHIVQPAVSQQVARLERELGTRLLDRSSRHVRLTPAGHRVLAAAREALAAAERVHAAVDAPATRVRIGTAPGLTGRLELGLRRLQECSPDLEIQLFDLPVPERLAAVGDGRLDLAVARGEPVGPGLVVHRAWDEQLSAVVSDRNPLARRSSVRLSTLAGSGPFRPPCRDTDPPWHAALAGIVAPAGARVGRPVGVGEAVVAEMGADRTGWTLLPAGWAAASGASRVREIPLDPPVTVTGSVVAPSSTTAACLAAVVDAFRDADLTGLASA
ncbi:LysR family transcriptional regulator [Pseudonocardia sp. ICBG1293]|uniref:LysR family transcriptional regulator n=1 Tax=Pseudonocardia sp. ICBG1293 TaxID=2844382 RepID=UPI001CCB960B|nr:LysR family transcriptional regulator [Pseudonocardia sp. ICBG1293]